jgi:hypothetical protein
MAGARSHETGSFGFSMHAYSIHRAIAFMTGRATTTSSDLHAYLGLNALRSKRCYLAQVSRHAQNSVESV